MKRTIKKIWQTICLYGLPDQCSKREYKILILGNQVLLIFLSAAIFMAAFTVFFWYEIYLKDCLSGEPDAASQIYRDYLPYYSIPSFFIITVISVLFFIRPKVQDDQLLAFTLVSCGVIYAGSLTILLGADVNFQLIVLMFIPPSLFFVRSITFAVFQTVFITLSYIGLQLYVSQTDAMLPVPAVVVPYANFFMTLNSAVVLGACSFYLWYETEHTERGLEKAQQETAHSLERVQLLLEQVQKFKEQQDGDYFLITLLIQPLLDNSRVGLGNLEADSFLVQKKSFEFRGRKREIGGDINICDQIKLQGEDYLVLVNADAMGKSIQGAGGALVFGTVFHSIINRTQSRAQEQMISPAKWIISSLLEVQDIFTCFAGTMSISLVIVLVDSSGKIYFVNIGQPYLVIYRDLKATFLEKTVHGLGVGYGDDLFNGLRVRMYQLLPGDNLVFGSDERDDIVFNGSGEINDKHEVFLRFVESSSGDPEALYNEITQVANMTDDFSIVRLKYLKSG